jgi:hypothetical protein
MERRHLAAGAEPVRQNPSQGNGCDMAPVGPDETGPWATGRTGKTRLHPQVGSIWPLCQGRWGSTLHAPPPGPLTPARLPVPVPVVDTDRLFGSAKSPGHTASSGHSRPRPRPHAFRPSTWIPLPPPPPPRIPSRRLDDGDWLRTWALGTGTGLWETGSLQTPTSDRIPSSPQVPSIQPATITTTKRRRRQPDGPRRDPV